MKTLTLLMVFLAASALADVELRVNRMEVAAADVSEETTEEAETRDAASGLPTGKRQHAPMAVDPDSDGDSLEDAADACDDDCDSAVDEAADVRKEVQEAKPAH